MKKKYSYSAYILCIAIVVFIFTRFCYQLCTVVGDSMLPTCTNGTLLLMQKYQLADNLQHNDIIVIKHSSTQQTLVKRVIGLPGDTITICNGIVYLNDSPYEEAASFPLIENAGNAIAPMTLSANQYFVLGDNRNNSIDSRFDEIGIIDFSQISGKVIYIF